MAAIGWRWGLALPVALLAPVSVAAAQASDDVPAAIAVRAAELIPILNGEGDVARTFTPQYNVAVPEAELRRIAGAITASLGKAMAISRIEPSGPRRARLEIAYQRGSAYARIELAPGDGEKINGLVITGTQPRDVAALSSLAAVAQAFAALPGEVGFIVAMPGRPPQVSLNGGKAYGTGSAFKLVVLAELVRQIEAGQRRWTDELALDGRELPAGGFAGKPAGTRVSLRKLAEEMIRISDNSATDLLLDALGRKQVEAMQVSLGVADPSRNVPFLSTMEAFKLKGVERGAFARRYWAADLSRKRAMLAALAQIPGSATGDLFADGKPVMIDRIEWFFSGEDLVRMLDWFERGARLAAGKEALRILALNPGPGVAVTDQVAYLGYKGGSEPGVLNMSVLLRQRDGGVKVVAASWNDPAAPVDIGRFTALFQRALMLAAG